MDLFEIVGTGGDNAHSFNISTTSAIVAAAGSMKEGVALAAELIDSGKAYETLEKLIEVSNRPEK